MPTFTSQAELDAYVKQRAEIAVFNTVQKIYSVIHKYVEQFYGEYSPTEYMRTENLLKSLVRVHGGLHGEVYFDESSYLKGEVPLQSGETGWAVWPDEKVLSAAMKGSHGGWAYGTPIWARSRAELGDIVSLVAKELRKAGLPVV